MEKNKIFSTLISFDVKRIEIHFSGGCDDGGIDGYYFYNSFDAEITEEDLEAIKSNAAIIEFLTKPIYESDKINFNYEYGVSGVLNWNIPDRTCTVDLDRRIIDYEHESYIAFDESEH
jgi:hypothetical protein